MKYREIRASQYVLSGVKWKILCMQTTLYNNISLKINIMDDKFFRKAFIWSHSYSLSKFIIQPYHDITLLIFVCHNLTTSGVSSGSSRLCWYESVLTFSHANLRIWFHMYRIVLFVYFNFGLLELLLVSAVSSNTLNWELNLCGFFMFNFVIQRRTSYFNTSEEINV